MIKVIISDLDGVIRTYPESRNTEYETRLALPPGSLIQCAFIHSDLKDVVTGKISDNQWRHNISERLKKKSTCPIVAEIVMEWSEFPGLLDEHVISLLTKHSANRQLALMTNATDKLDVDLIKLNIFNLFDSILNSSKIGFAKPDKEFFLHALRTLELEANEIMFIDDRLENINAASELGFQCHHFIDFNSLKNALEKI